jgi:antitoxin component HigA of HigAB toxin-antitoxin module
MKKNTNQDMKIDVNFLTALTSSLEAYVKGKMQAVEILKFIECSLPEEDKANWNPKSEFKGYELIETFLEVHGMTQVELARLLDSTPAKLNDLIKGRRKISSNTAHKLAKLFKVEHTAFL